MLYLCIVFGGIADDALKQGPLLRIAFFDLLIQLLVSPKSTWCTGWRIRRANWCFFLKNERNFRITSETGRTTVGGDDLFARHIVRRPGRESRLCAGCSKTERPHGRGLVSDSLLPALINDKMTGEMIFCLQMHEKFMKKM